MKNPDDTALFMQQIEERGEQSIYVYKKDPLTGKTKVLVNITIELTEDESLFLEDRAAMEEKEIEVMVKRKLGVG